jgi:hypothetical protein
MLYSELIFVAASPLSLSLWYYTRSSQVDKFRDRQALSLERELS